VSEGRLPLRWPCGRLTAGKRLDRLGERLSPRAPVGGRNAAGARRHKRPGIAKQLLAQVWPKLPARTHIVPPVDSVHPLGDAAKVHEYFDRGAHIGKIVLVP